MSAIHVSPTARVRLAVGAWCIVGLVLRTAVASRIGVL
jgi:hypothetical protein